MVNWTCKNLQTTNQPTLALGLVIRVYLKSFVTGTPVASDCVGADLVTWVPKLALIDVWEVSNIGLNIQFFCIITSSPLKDISALDCLNKFFDFYPPTTDTAAFVPSVTMEVTFSSKLMGHCLTCGPLRLFFDSFKGWLSL